MSLHAISIVIISGRSPISPGVGTRFPGGSASTSSSAAAPAAHASQMASATASTPATHASLASLHPPYAAAGQPHSAAWRASYRHGGCPAAAASSTKTSSRLSRAQGQLLDQSQWNAALAEERLATDPRQGVLEGGEVLVCLLPAVGRSRWPGGLWKMRPAAACPASTHNATHNQWMGKNTLTAQVLAGRHRYRK